MSLHSADVKAAVAASWPLREHPTPLAEAGRVAFPAKGEAPNPALWLALAVVGVWRLAVVAVGTLLIAFVAGETRTDGRRTPYRAAVSLAVCVVAVATHLVARHLT